MGANCLGCNPRELTAEALRRELPGVQPPQALGLQSLPDVWYAKQNPGEECLL